MCTNTEGSYNCSCNSGFVLNEDGYSCTPEPHPMNNTDDSLCPVVPPPCPPNSSCETPCATDDECTVNNGGCDHKCVNTNDSYYCECNPGYTLKPDGHSCGCGGNFTERTGSFHTPGWPSSYPLEDLHCEWTVTRDVDSSSLILFQTNSDHFGIDGSPPCTTDYVQFFSGTDSITDPICSTQAPGNRVAFAATGTVIFKGSNNNDRPSGLAGVKVTYTIM